MAFMIITMSVLNLIINLDPITIRLRFLSEPCIPFLLRVMQTRQNQSSLSLGATTMPTQTLVGLALPVKLLNGIFLEEYARPVECSGIKSAPPANLPTPAPCSAFSGLIRVLLVLERAEAFFTCFFNFFNSLELSSVSKGGNLLPTAVARDDTELLANISSALKAGCVAFKFDGVNVLLLIVLDTCDVSSESSDTSMGSSAFKVIGGGLFMPMTFLCILKSIPKRLDFIGFCLFNDNPLGVDVAAIAIICCCNCFSFKENIGNILAAAPVSNGLLGFRGFNRGAPTALYGGGNNPVSIFSFLFFLSIAFDRTPGNFGEFLLPGLRPRFFGLLTISTFSAAFSPNTRLSIDKS
uniref:Uncharacterized protein n=1 Tax=Glossina palpalis gambiensis TaxID=67801 RepID=A0A1B0AN15_9MUSC